MTTLVLNNSELVEAVKKASVSLKDTYVLSVINKELKSGKRHSGLSCCNGNTQTAIFLTATADADACGEYVFGKEFGTIVSTLSAYDESDFIIKRKEDGTCTISCGSAVVPIPVRDSATKIQIEDPKKSNPVIAEIEAGAFKQAVNRGGCSYSTSIGGNYEMIRNAINLVPEKQGDKYFLRFATTDGAMAAGSRALISKQEALDKIAEGDLSLSVNATVFTKIATILTGEKVVLYMTKSQLLIRDGYDMYAIIPNAAQFPASVSQLLLTTPKENYRFKVSKKRMLSALEVALLAASNSKVCVKVEDGVLTVYGKGGCRGDLETSEISGSVQMALNARLLKTLLSHMGEDILFYGEGLKSPIYISDGVEGSMCFLAPASVGDDSDEEEPTDKGVDA